MTPPTSADPREVALEIARHVDRGALLSRTLGRELDHVSLDARDRALVTDLAYGMVRWRIWLDAALAPRLRDPDALPDDVRDILRLGAFEKLVRGTPPHAAVSSWVDVAKRHQPALRGLVNAVLRRVEAPRDPSPAVSASMPETLWRRLEAVLDDRAAGAAAAMREPGPLWLVAYDAEAEAQLRDEGCEVEPGPLDGTLRVRPSRRLGDLAAFARGGVQPMNPASLAVARALPVEPGQRVLDLCSGRGVKSAALAARGARVEAIERSDRKIEQARRNLDRLGFDVRHRRADLSTPPGTVAPAAAVLLDAPCSGTGTLRGHPEIALRFDEHDLGSLVKLQSTLLDSAAALTAPAGVLVYAVCALTPEEGPQAIEAFLGRQRAFQPEPVDLPVPSMASGPGAFLVPEEGLDGFFLARLRRTA